MKRSETKGPNVLILKLFCPLCSCRRQRRIRGQISPPADSGTAASLPGLTPSPCPPSPCLLPPKPRQQNLVALSRSVCFLIWLAHFHSSHLGIICFHYCFSSCFFFCCCIYGYHPHLRGSNAAFSLHTLVLILFIHSKNRILLQV